MKKNLSNLKKELNLLVMGANTWKCWDPGENESEVTSHGKARSFCLSRKQVCDVDGQGLAEESLCRDIVQDARTLWLYSPPFFLEVLA